MTLVPMVLGLASLASASATASGWVVAQLAPAPADREAYQLVQSSPWWENYDIKERFLCSEKGGVVLERNDSQASLISGDSRTTFFREPSEAPGLLYRNDEMRLILRGDELTLERLPMKLTCLRSEEV